MTMYYPTYRQEGEENGIDVRSLHSTVLLCIGLFSLLHLQYVHQGHMDEPVYLLFEIRMHEMEAQLANTLAVHKLEDAPF